MTSAEFEQLVDLVVNTGLTPPKILFQAGFDDWYTRISLARFLSHPAYGRMDEAVELLESVVNIQPREPEFLEQKIWSLKRLSLIFCRCRPNTAACPAFRPPLIWRRQNKSIG